jgi:hypothetical protein
MFGGFFSTLLLLLLLLLQVQARLQERHQQRSGAQQAGEAHCCCCCLQLLSPQHASGLSITAQQPLQTLFVSYLHVADTSGTQSLRFCARCRVLTGN